MIARWSVLLIAAVITSPIILKAYQGTAEINTVLQRYLITVVICGFAMEFLRRMYNGYVNNSKSLMKRKTDLVEKTGVLSKNNKP